MSKKQKKEELLKTHVININEIREAEACEKNNKLKKMVVVFVIIGLMFIGTGSFINKLVKNNSSEEKIVVSTHKNDNSMSCIANFEDSENSLKIYTKTIYKFDESGVISASSSNSEITSLDNQVDLINGLRDKYSEIYINSNGVNYNITINGNVLYFSVIVSDYSLFDYTSYNGDEDKLLLSKMFRSGTKREYIRENLEKKGFLCS